VCVSTGSVAGGASMNQARGTGSQESGTTVLQVTGLGGWGDAQASTEHP
jgi:hypothetical protein